MHSLPIWTTQVGLLIMAFLQFLPLLSLAAVFFYISIGHNGVTKDNPFHTREN